ncbi:MAG: hypothetical protein QNJ14_16185 [Woeseiaceae bacterium]|nr:hypothetical protein [Woeseiaceae bacterium]
MNGDNGDNDETDIEESTEDDFDEETEPTADVADIGTETIVSTTAEFKVDEIVAKIDKADPDEVAHKREVRKRLEEIAEERDEAADSTFNFNLDDEL